MTSSRADAFDHAKERIATLRGDATIVEIHPGHEHFDFFVDLVAGQHSWRQGDFFSIQRTPFGHGDCLYVHRGDERPTMIVLHRCFFPSASRTTTVDMRGPRLYDPEIIAYKESHPDERCEMCDFVGPCHVVHIKTANALGAEYTGPLDDILAWTDFHASDENNMLYLCRSCYQKRKRMNPDRKRQALYYLCMVDGIIQEHKAWQECQAASVGKKGEKHAKVCDEEDAKRVKKLWGAL
jgi:hypothetical protein